MEMQFLNLINEMENKDKSLERIIEKLDRKYFLMQGLEGTHRN
jgi:hypothetical protein